MRFLKIVLIFVLILIFVTGVSTWILYSKIPKIERPVSILILGKGGIGHTAPNLTDTIMISHLNTDKKNIKVVSLPRDLWVDEIRAKLNTAYHYGGFKMATDSVYTVTGVPVNYTVVVDFSLFKDLIDTIGGINVNVVNSFTDEKYPIAGLEEDLCDGDRLFKCRYETIKFEKGQVNMNGELALKFVRSRNAVGDEGTDLAREKRQQQVISGIKEKLLSRQVLTDFEVLKKLYNTLLSHVETDMDRDTAIGLFKFVLESQSNVFFLTFPEELVKVSQGNKKYDKQYVFIPTSGSWQEINNWMKNNLQN